MDYKLIQSKNFRTYLSYCLITLPILLISGPFLSDLSISILAIASLFFLRDKKYFKNLFFFLFILFWIITLISSTFSEHKLLAFKSSLFYFRFGLFSIFVWYLLDTEKNILTKIYKVLIFCFLALILDSFFQYFFGTNILNMKIGHENRISSFFGDELKMGGFFLRLFPLFIALSFFYYNQKIHKNILPLCICFILLVLLVIFLSGERTSFFLFNFLIILYLIFLNEFKKIKFIFLLFYASIFSILILVDSPFKKRIIDQSLSQMNINNISETKYIFSKQYHEHYKSAWEMFKDNKLIGIGPKNFREKCKIEKYNYSDLTCSTHPHNILLQIMSETGLFGLLIYSILNFSIWYTLFKSLVFKLLHNKIIYSNFQISLLIHICILVWPLSPNGNVFNNWLSILLYYPAGFLFWSFKK